MPLLELLMIVNECLDGIQHSISSSDDNYSNPSLNNIIRKCTNILKSDTRNAIHMYQFEPERSHGNATESPNTRLNHCFHNVEPDQEKDDDIVLFSNNPATLAEAVADRADDIIRSIPFKEVNIYHRSLHETGALLKACSVVIHGMPVSSGNIYEEVLDEVTAVETPKGVRKRERTEYSSRQKRLRCESWSPKESDLLTALKNLDLTLLISGCPFYRTLIHRFITCIESLLPTLPLLSPPPAFVGPLPHANLPTFHRKTTVHTYQSPPSLTAFANILKQDDPQPVLIKGGALEHWPAMSTRPWSEGILHHRSGGVGSLRTLLGHRWVPIEIGAKYTDDTWTQEIMTFDDFLVKFMGFRPSLSVSDDSSATTSTLVGYLAQHDLFAQVPKLFDDISVPEYCYAGSIFSDDDDTDKHDKVMVSAWFGPSDTVSPLHTDPHMNLFAQVVGRKYFKLFSPSETSSLYPHSENMLGNTSMVDAANPDLEAFPEFKKANFLECIVEEGDLLFIPVCQ
ncbi:Lysine-specific demethylase 8 [Dinochytrium kinnereticum]|nr:Lysine-specific demethylase 8 [Dinochytrium kinnereticum]